MNQIFLESFFFFFFFFWAVLLGFPGSTSGKESACQCWSHKICGFDPWIRKILWRRAWQLTQVFLPGDSHGQKSLAGYSPRGLKDWDRTEVTCMHAWLWNLVPRSGMEPGLWEVKVLTTGPSGNSLWSTFFISSDYLGFEPHLHPFTGDWPLVLE